MLALRMRVLRAHDIILMKVYHMSDARNPAPLSVHWAFVVQFHAETVVEQGRLVGRVEHVVSGQATDFQSLETLLAFISEVLRQERDHTGDYLA